MFPQFLKGSSFVVFQTLCQALEEGEEPSHFDLAVATGYTTPTVRKALTKLEDEGYIRVHRDNGRKHRYEVVPGMGV